MRRLMYIVFFLLMAANLLAQETYVIDSACIGAERLYRRNGEKLYTYDWYVLDTAGNVISNPTGVDFMEVNAPGDTIWGNEFMYLWNMVGEFDIEVQVYTEHGCDTISSGRIKIYELPEAEAGPDRVLCGFEPFNLRGDSAWNHSVLYWSTTGDGYFDDEYILHPTYNLGPGDVLNGEVKLYITAEGLADNGTCEPAVDSVTYQFSQPDITFTVRDPLCYNDSSGAITANISGGMPPYRFEWTGPPGFVTRDDAQIPNLGAGWYVLKVIDANNCFDIDSVELFNPPKIIVNIDDVQHVSCFGYNDGSITASAFGGTGSLWFEWKNSTGFQYFGSNVNNLPADTYVLYVSDENNCEKIDTVVITEPDSLLAEINAIDTICEGEITSITGSTIGGTGSLLYTWSGSGSAYLVVNNDSIADFGPAPQGSYEIIFAIEDELGCQATDTIEIIVYPPSNSYEELEMCAGDAPFVWNSHTIVNTRDSIYLDTLFGANQYGCDSMLTLNVKVLFPEYRYDTLYVCENEEPFVQYSQLIQPGIDSAYLDTVKYTNSGCDSLYIGIQVYTLPVTDTMLDSTLCAGAPEFFWNNRFIVTDRDSIYLDTLKNSFGCDSLLTYNIQIIPPDTFNTDTIICQGEPAFVWNGVDILTNTDSLYEARLTNIYGCDSLVLMDVSILPATDTLLDLLVCEGAPSFTLNNRQILSIRDSIYLDTLVNSYGCDSLLTYDVRVIPPDTTYVFDTLCQGDPTYVWNGITIQTQNDSIYEATLQNKLTCDSTIYLTVSILQGIVIDTFVEACETFTWSSGTGNTYSATGIYDHIVGAGSCADTLRLHLLISPPIDLGADPTDVLCFGDASGSIDLTVSGGIPPYNILWDNGETTEDISGLTAGIYSVTVSDSLGCSEFLNVEILQPDAIVANIDSIVPAELPGDPSGSVWVSVSGGTPGYTFEWRDELGNYIDGNEDLLNQPDGDYSLLIIDNNICMLTIQVTIPVKDSILPPPGFNLDCPTDLTLSCLEELPANPIATTLEEYLSIESGLQVYSDCGIDSTSFTYRDSIVTASIFCYEEYRFYSITDSCGNEMTCVHHLIVDDAEIPTIVCPPDLALTNASAPVSYTQTEFVAAGGTLDDNCGIIRFEKITENISGTFTQVIERTYEVEDACGNTNQCIHTITITNTTSLVLTCPPTIELCPSDAIPPVINSITGFIAAGGDTASNISPIVPASFTHVKDSSDGLICPETIYRIYEISNEAGESDRCEQIIIRGDDQAPYIKNIPGRTIYACGFSIPAQLNLSTIEKYVNENCALDDIRVTESYNYRNGTCDYDIIRDYRVADECGNWSNVERQIITIKDTTPPLVFPPGSSAPYLPEIVSNDCTLPDPISDISVFRTQGVTIMDECNEPVSMTYIGMLPALAAEPNVIFYVYRFADACDNYVDKQQRVILQGMDIPEFDPIGPLCQFTSAPELPTTSINGITGTWSPATINTSVPNITTYIFTPDDGECAVPTGVVVEVTPEIQLSETHVDVGLSPNPIGSVNLIVSGGTPPFIFNWDSGQTTEDLANLYAGTYSVHVTDIIGCEADLTVEVTSDKPDMDCGPALTIDCPDEVPPVYNTFTEYQAAGGTATSSIGIDESSFRFVSEDTVETSYCLTLERTYAISDDLGNESMCTQTIHVDDQIDPVITCPPGGSAECLSASVADIETLEEFEAAGGSVSDNCEIDRSSFTFTRTVNKQINQSEVITTYTISDLCGNTASCTQTFILTDIIPPEAICRSITVYLDENGQYVLTEIDMDTISYGSNDNCTSFDDLIIEVTPSTFTCEDVESGQRVTVVVYDEAGNVGECQADIIVADTFPPVALCQDLTIYLDENGQASITAGMIDNGSFDNCTDVTLELDKYDFDCENVGENLVKLTVTDGYGMQSSCTAVVTVIDQIPPYISCVAPDTIQLGLDGTFTLTWEMVADSVWDECGIDTVLLNDYLLDCDNIGVTEITATAYDVNGNSSFCTTEFIIIGNTPPNVQNDSAITAINVPVDINVVQNDYDLKTNINVATLGVISGPSHGSVVVDNNTGIVTYSPDLNYEGTDIFRYTICDDGIPCVPECGEAIVYITVMPANLPPVALDDYYDVPCISLTGNVTDNDGPEPDGDNIEVNPSPIVPATNGDLILYPDGHFEYEPFLDFTEGIDSFQYEIRDVPVVDPVLYDSAWVYITRVPDNDCDGIADADDIDDDNDGIRDIYEGDTAIDSDQDGIPDSWDIDSDNDGILDNIEGQDEFNYIEPDGWRDDNNNGWDDRYDNDEGGFPFDLNLTDTDGDGIPDFRDTDSDNDNVLDFIEGNDDNADGIADYMRFYSDLDRDGLDDAYDWIDGWGIPNLIDNETGSISPLQDFDGDGIRDWRDVNDEDDDYLTINEDINGDGDYSNDDLDLDGRPEYLDTEVECELFIPEGFSPNDDGVHDFFQILCIYPRYPDAKLMIFNRNGQLIWEKEHYGNFDFWGWQEAWWWGTSENRLTIGRSGGLPAGNYIYVLELNDGLGTVHNGTVMIAY